MRIVKGPMAPHAEGTMIYQITLASGMIITNPAGFGLDEQSYPVSQAVISESGKILSSPRINDAFEKGEDSTNDKAND